MDSGARKSAPELVELSADQLAPYAVKRFGSARITESYEEFVRLRTYFAQHDDEYVMSGEESYDAVYAFRCHSAAPKGIELSLRELERFVYLRPAAQEVDAGFVFHDATPPGVYRVAPDTRPLPDTFVRPVMHNSTADDYLGSALAHIPSFTVWTSDPAGALVFFRMKRSFDRHDCISVLLWTRERTFRNPAIHVVCQDETLLRVLRTSLEINGRPFMEHSPLEATCTPEELDLFKSHVAGARLDGVSFSIHRQWTAPHSKPNRAKIYVDWTEMPDAPLSSSARFIVGQLGHVHMEVKVQLSSKASYNRTMTYKPHKMCVLERCELE